MRFKGVSLLGWCVVLGAVAGGCNLQRMGEPEEKSEAVGVAQQALKAETLETLAAKRLQDIQTMGATIDQQKLLLASGEVKDPVAYAEIVAEIERQGKARVALEGGIAMADTSAAPAIASPVDSTRAAKEAALVREMARYDMSKPADVAAYGAKKREILGE